MLKRTPEWLVNHHIEPMFRFTPAQVELMRQNFSTRAGLSRALFPWDGPNFGLDEQWLASFPTAARPKRDNRSLSSSWF
ncbi:MAG: hypothetical protein IT165_31060 [Bryobacterales bacterium]|nr:hypothetical protein [Bryobacterales bacterium]